MLIHLTRMLYFSVRDFVRERLQRWERDVPLLQELQHRNIAQHWLRLG
jgi:hypothetical protein